MQARSRCQKGEGSSKSEDEPLHHVHHNGGGRLRPDVRTLGQTLASVNGATSGPTVPTRADPSPEAAPTPISRWSRTNLDGP